MSSLIQKGSERFLYQQVIDLIVRMQSDGTLRPGDKLPSLRKLSQQLDVSIPTIKQAYIELERLGKVDARAKSGYFLKVASLEISSPKRPKIALKPVPVRCQTLIEKVYEVVHAQNKIPLGISHPVMASPPDKILARLMRRVLASAGPKAMAYGPMDGYLPLKRQIAQRYLERGVPAAPESIIVTNGAQEALAIALQCVAKAGDVIAVESPTYFGILELIESLGMMALEIPCCSNGLCLDDLEESINKHRVTACIFSSLINNPTGSAMSSDKRRWLVEFLESKNIPLIEDDVYGELHFGEDDAVSLQAYSKKGLVITCSSFSKTAAPSYRVGWILSQRFEQKAKGFKRALSCSSSLLNQWVLYEYIRSGDYDRNIKRLRQVLLTNKERMRTLIAKYFPHKTSISDPQGGGVVWVELPKGCEAIELFHKAANVGISISPGVLYSPSGKYKRCTRISYGLPWSEEVEQAIKTLGKLAHEVQALELSRVG